MKYLIALIAGMVVGAALFIIGMVYNPLVGARQLSPISVTDTQTMALSYSVVPSDSIVFTNDGESRADPFPEKVLQLWEAPVRQTSAMTTVLRNARNKPAGIGIKFSSLSENTRLLEGEALIDSVWYLYLPGRGSLFVEQSENYWGVLREVIFPAYRSSANTWRGTWIGNITAGPGALGTAKVTGGSGEFENEEMLGVESLQLRAWSVDDGPIAATGQLIIELPRHDLAQDE